MSTVCSPWHPARLYATIYNTNGYMTNALMKRVCNRKSYRESRELPVRMPQCAAERDRWNVTEDGLLSGVDEHGKCKFTKGSALYSGEVEWWLHPQRLSVARLIVNGSGNTDFRLPWDLRIVTEVMRSECRGDFLYNRKLSFLLYKKPPAGCAFARRSRMSQATALSARMCQGTFYISYIR